MAKDKMISIRCTNEEKQRINKNATDNHMSVGTYIVDCCTDKKVSNKRKRQRVGCILVNLIQLCNDSPELKQQIGGYVCQLKECL